MRIVMVNWSRRRAGGGESYLAQVIPDIVDAGHDVALLVECDEPVAREPIELPDNTPWWNVREVGIAEAVRRVEAWQPDVILSHGILDNRLEDSLLGVAPAVAFAHNYYGTCISGGKTWKSPPVRPCSRVFGVPCLLHYYPHSCGGKNPLTMIRGFRTQANRLHMLRRYGAIVTASEHMRQEYLRHGFHDEAVRAIPYPTPGWDSLEDSSAGAPGSASGPAPRLPEAPRDGHPWNLAFMGRMEQLKGADVLIDALPIAASALGVRLHAQLIGDGPERERWTARARLLTSAHPDVSVSLPGWLSGLELAAALDTTHIVAVPSLWPEPYGLVGPESGLRGIPAVAFDVGGIRQWLHEGVNGHLASGSPPSAAGLAAAIVRMIEDPDHWRALSANAVRVARSFTRSGHVRALLDLLGRVGQHRRASGG